MQIAKERDIKKLICSDLESIQLKELLPAIDCFDVIEYIEDDYSFMKTVYHSLAENGKVFITVPAFTFLWTSADEAAGHFRRYTTKSAKKLLEESGFKVLERKYFLHTLCH